MCGITAYIGKFGAFKYIIDGLTILQNRGYDSAGITTINRSGGKFVTTKFANDPGTTNSLEKIRAHASLHTANTIGIGHTRWATHGGKSDQNAHPHLDCHNRLAVVHNGIIENYLQLKKFLIERGYTFTSQTDTEVIANLISYFISTDPQLTNEGAISKACQQLEGTWGLAILFADDPEHLYVSRNGSPILVGYNDDDDITIVASESCAFANSVNKYIIVGDHEILKVGRRHHSKDFLKKYEVKNVSFDSLVQLTPDPYPHWMLKEIMDQPNSIQRSLNMGGRFKDDYQVRLGGLESNSDALLAINHLLIIAMGTSYHAALMGSKIFKLLKSVNALTVLDASEFTEDDIPYPRETVGALFLSQSGETKDVHLALEIAKKAGLTVFSVVNVVDSLIARDADCGIYLNAGREVAVASTKSFTSQVVVLALIAIWYAQNKGISRNLRHQLIKEIRNLSYNCQCVIDTLQTTVSPAMLSTLGEASKIFILGRQMGHALALEGALKIKEVSYLHAEGYPGGALKHGPFALIESTTPIIILAFRDEFSGKMQITAEEVKARGCPVILITDSPELNNHLYDHIIKINHSGYLSPLLGIIPLQYMAYCLSIGKGYNPDYPRNLAKCVTTE